VITLVVYDFGPTSDSNKHTITLIKETLRVIDSDTDFGELIIMITVSSIMISFALEKSCVSPKFFRSLKVSQSKKG
jgi:hypothetical protein